MGSLPTSVYADRLVENSLETCCGIDVVGYDTCWQDCFTPSLYIKHIILSAGIYVHDKCVRFTCVLRMYVWFTRCIRTFVT